jgi:PAS domain S-box-containing protein
MKKDTGDASTKVESAHRGVATRARPMQRLVPRQEKEGLFVDYNQLYPPEKNADVSDLKHAVERYAALYDFAPTGYINFDRAGRITEINFTAMQLLGGLPRQRVVGLPFAVFVSREDSPLFLHHLLRCRNNVELVETELRLKNWKGEVVPVRLSSRLISNLPHNGATVFQTAIVDLTERKAAEAAQTETTRQQAALYELARRRQDAKSLNDIYEGALNAILSALHADRASILLFDQNKVMRFVAWRGLSKKYRTAVEGHSPWKRDTKRPKPICIPDVETADLPKSLKATVLAEGIQALAFIPLITGKKLIGKFMAYYNAPHSFTDGELKLTAAIAQDLVQAIQHEKDKQALLDKEAELELIITQTPFMLTRCSRDLRYRYVSRAYAKMFGRKPEDIAGKPISEILGKRGLNRILPHIQKVLGGRIAEYEEEISRSGTRRRWWHCIYTPDRNLEGKVIGWFASITNVTRQKKAEAALRKSKELLESRVRDRTHELATANQELNNEIARRKGLEGEILSVSDREQQRLGQELHDGLCQHLTAVAFMARSIALRLRDHRVIDAADIEKIADLVNKAAVDTRNLSRALHRVDVDAAGLVTALQDLVDREIWRTPCRLELKGSFQIDSDVAAAHLYRIAREAVINANKHARARQIIVGLERSQQEMVLRVIDDGVGFPKNLKPQQGLGYHIMKYRAQLIAGRLEIHSPRTGGTRLSCYVPVYASRSRKGQNRDELAADISNLRMPAAGSRILRHLAQQGAANGIKEDKQRLDSRP